MQNTVAPAGLGQIKEGAAQEALSGVTKGQPNRVVHPSGDDHFQLAAIGPRAIDMGGARLERLPIAKHVALRSKSSLAPVEKTVRAEIGSVHIITTVFYGPAVEPDSPLIRNMVAIGVAQFPDVWRSPYINRALMHEDAFGKRQALGKDGRLIKHAIAVPIDQA